MGCDRSKLQSADNYFSLLHDSAFLELCHNLLHEGYIAQFLAAAHFLIVHPLVVEEHLADAEVSATTDWFQVIGLSTVIR